MPCHVASHPSDSNVYFVQKARDESLKLVEHIMELGQKMEETTSIEGKEDDILFHIGLNPKLQMVQVCGHGNRVNDDMAAYKIARAARAAAAYKPLFDLLTAEMCRLCRLSEKKKGRFLTYPQQKWWDDHKTSRGHEA